jgi:hypothetical protein
MTLTGTSEGEQCNVGHFSNPVSDTGSEGIGQLQNGLGGGSFLVPDANDPDHYAGRATLNHIETQRIGLQVYHDYVEWDFRRRRAP